MTDTDLTTPDHAAEPAPEPDGPPPAPPRPVAPPARVPPNGDSENAIDVALDERRRLLDFLEEMRREQAIERRQWFALIERLSNEQSEQERWPIRIWNWLIANTPEPYPSPGAGPAVRQSRRAPPNGGADRRSEPS